MADGGPWLMSSGGGCGMRVAGGRDGWKMEAEDGGRTGHPGEFPNAKSNKSDIFLDVRGNW